MLRIETFLGFPDKGLKFLAELEKNNNKKWFDAHKGEYQEFLLHPAQAFVATLGKRLQKISKGLQYDTNANGSGSLMRIYRDVRFSKDKTPYKTNLGIVFWEGEGKKTENPGYYVHIDAQGAKVFAGNYCFSKPFMNAYRTAVVDNRKGGELEKVIQAVKKAGASEIGGEHYKRVPRGFDAEHKRAGYLKHNGLYVLSKAIPKKDIKSEKFVEHCFKWCEKMAPLHRWLVKVNKAVQD